MAYCLRSFVETLDQVLNPKTHHKDWELDHRHTPQIQSLYDNANFLQNFFDQSSQLIQEKIANLEDQIMEAAEKGADALESHITSQILSSPENQTFTISPPDLGEVLRAFEVAKQEVIKIKHACQQSEPYMPPPISSATPYLDSRKLVVGAEDDLNQLRLRLAAPQPELDIIPIVGMGGIGKTTLARILYDERSSSTSHFECRAWVTVSQSYSLHQILKKLLNCVGGNSSYENINELKVALHKALFRRAYLIVIDDIWSYEAWEAIQSAFPEDGQRSRVIFTTRVNKLVDRVNSNSHKMHFMNEEDSWELLRGTVFGEESCPCELEEVGKKIAKSCRGLPLALQVIGGVLFSHSEKSQHFWEHVVYNTSSLIEKSDDQFSGIFSWSYANLPHYLKPCFLYMGAFPEDGYIPASDLVKMWVAEGFLYPYPDKSLSIEEAAELHLDALVDRNLIFVRERKRYDGKVKYYGIHDLLRDLCLMKSQKKKFIHVKNSKTNIQKDTSCLRRVSVHLSRGDDEEHFLSLKLTSPARSLLVIGSAPNFPSWLCSELSLLRVLDGFYTVRSMYPENIFKLVNLRYLALNIQSMHLREQADILDRNISVLKNLQTLVVERISFGVILDLPQLRHLNVYNQGDLNEVRFENNSNIHENLQSINWMPLQILLKLVDKLPNLRRLRLFCYMKVDNLDLTSFDHLETLKLHIRDPIPNIKFPYSLKQLHLKYISPPLPQFFLDAVGQLPNLEVLKFIVCHFENATWEPKDGEFLKLQYLQLTVMTLDNWSATEFHFPVLRHLYFDQIRGTLSELPIGDILTLEIIELNGCSPLLLQSAMGILEEQRQMSNNVLQVRLGPGSNSSADRVRTKDGRMLWPEVPELPY